jgi:EAL domain-containing protein (putative c-di-GMP-specific phosphodiesterase class I)
LRRRTISVALRAKRTWRHRVKPLSSWVHGESVIFIRAMVGLSPGLNLSVTAEGIETEAQAVAALEQGVDQAQGFLFGKAVPAPQVPQLLATPAQLVA